MAVGKQVEDDKNEAEPLQQFTLKVAYPLESLKKITDESEEQDPNTECFANLQRNGICGI